MKTYVIGDIHGCCDEFDKLLQTMKPDLTKDKLILLGDYIDRGDKSYEVVKAVQKLRQHFGTDHVIVLKGNHEQMAIEYFEEGIRTFQYNGGRATMESFRRNGEELEDYIKFFKELTSWHEDEYFIYVHGGVKPGVRMSDQREQELLWIREEFYLSQTANEKTVIFGHTPTCNINGAYKPVTINRNIAVDTACVYGGALSALEIEEGCVVKVRQVKSTRKNWRNICA